MISAIITQKMLSYFLGGIGGSLPNEDLKKVSTRRIEREEDAVLGRIGNLASRLKDKLANKSNPTETPLEPPSQKTQAANETSNQSGGSSIDPERLSRLAAQLAVGAYAAYAYFTTPKPPTPVTPANSTTAPQTPIVMAQPNNAIIDNSLTDEAESNAEPVLVNLIPTTMPEDDIRSKDKANLNVTFSAKQDKIDKLNLPDYSRVQNDVPPPLDEPTDEELLSNIFTTVTGLEHSLKNEIRRENIMENNETGFFAWLRRKLNGVGNSSATPTASPAPARPNVSSVSGGFFRLPPRQSESGSGNAASSTMTGSSSPSRPTADRIGNTATPSNSTPTNVNAPVVPSSAEQQNISQTVTTGGAIIGGTAAAVPGSGAAPEGETVFAPTTGVLTSGHGMRMHPVNGTMRMHRGIDIAGNAGDPILSVMAGVVEFAGTMSGYGNRVVIRHKDGRATAYSHLNEIKTQKGQAVAGGQVIGTLGNTGVGTGPHLDFEYFERDGRLLNPAELLGLRNQGQRVQPGERLTAGQVLKPGTSDNKENIVIANAGATVQRRPALQPTIVQETQDKAKDNAPRPQNVNVSSVPPQATLAQADFGPNDTGLQLLNARSNI